MGFLILLIQSRVYFGLSAITYRIRDAKSPRSDAISRWFDAKSPRFDAISPHRDAISPGDILREKQDEAEPTPAPSVNVDRFLLDECVGLRTKGSAAIR